MGGNSNACLLGVAVKREAVRHGAVGGQAGSKAVDGVDLIRVITGQDGCHGLDGVYVLVGAVGIAHVVQRVWIGRVAVARCEVDANHKRNLEPPSVWMAGVRVRHYLKTPSV